MAIASGQDLEQIKDKVLRRLKQAEAHRYALEKKWVDWYKLYRCVLPSEARQTKFRRANIFVPQIFSDVETVAPRLVASTFASRPYVSVLPREGSDEESAKIMELLLDYQLSDRIKIKTLAGAWARDVLICGMGVVKVTWRVETRRMRVRVPDLLTPLAQEAYKAFGIALRHKEEERDVTVYDDPWIELVDVFDFFWDPRALTVDNARYVIQRSRVTMDYLKQMEEQGVFENIKEVKPRQISLHEGQVSRMSALGFQDIEPDPQEPEVELLEYWEDNFVAVLANNEVVVRAEPNPFAHGKKPFAVANIIPSRISLCGISLVEAAESLQHELNDLRNLRMDNATLMLYKPFTVIRGTDLNPDDFVFRPLQLIPVDDHETIRELTISDVRQSAYMDEQLVRDDIQKVTAAYDTFKGAPAPRRATATEIAGRLEQGSFRFQDMRTYFEATGPLAAAELVAALDQQFLGEQRLLRIVGPEGMRFVAVSFEDISGQYDYYFAGSATEPIANRDLRRQQIIQLYQVVARDPLVRREELLKIMFGLFDIKNPERFINAAQQQVQGGMIGVPEAVVQGMQSGM